MTSTEVYPIPSSNIIHFKLNQQVKGEIKLLVTDESGREIREQGFHETIFSIDVSRLKSGNYFYHLVNAGKCIESGQFVRE